jgi:hypothetical protein
LRISQRLTPTKENERNTDAQINADTDSLVSVLKEEKMQAVSVLRRVTLVFVLVLTLLLIGGSSHAPTAMAQQRTCYRFTKTITCADNVNQDYCQSSRDLILGKLPDGSVIGQVKGGTREDSCNFKYNSTDGFQLNCPSGTAQWGGSEPPPYMCSDQEQSFRAIAEARGQFASVSGRYWFSPAGTFQARPGGVGATGGLVPPGSRDPFTYIEATEDKNSGSGTQNSGFIKVLPARDLDKFSIGIVVSGWGKRPGGNATNGVGFGVEYVYERLSAGQEPPSSSAGSSSSGPSSSTGSASSTGASSSTGTGATNTTLPMPPFGQAEPYTNTPGMALQAAQRRVGVGELVLVPIWLIKGNNVANINYELTYNASVARPEGTIQKGNLLDNALFSANPNTSGIIRVGFAQTTGVSGTGTRSMIGHRCHLPSRRSTIRLARRWRLIESPAKS